LSNSQPDVALVTGITGQTGSYTAEILQDQGYSVVGGVRPGRGKTTVEQYGRSFPVVEIDLLDEDQLARVVSEVRPSMIFHYAADSFEPTAWEAPVAYAEVNALAPLRLLTVLQKVSPGTRFLQASSGLIFGKSEEPLQNEETPRRPHTPYGAAKAFAHESVRIYRSRYDLFACSAIFFNHESPRRPERFLMRKVTMGAARISAGLQDSLTLGSLDARKDWHYAKDAAMCAILMLQSEKPSDYVVASGVSHSVRDVLDIAFDEVGLNWQKYIKQDEQFMRPYETPMVGDCSKAERELGWKRTLDFEQLVRMMVRHDLELVKC
jgi:GDPmannose 4,6-dehydratase